MSETPLLVEPVSVGGTNGAGSPAWRSAARRESLAMELLARIGIPVVLGWLAVSVGVVMIVVGYYLVSGTADVAEQLARFSSACVGGLTFIGVGGLLILSHHYRETANVVDELRAEIAELRSGTKGHDGARLRGPAAPSTADVVVRVGNSGTFHTPDCIFVSGKHDVRGMPVAEARASQLRPCQVCAPGA